MKVSAALAGAFDIDYSDVQGCACAGTDGNIDASPDFRNPPNLYLLDSSPCIEVGSNGLLPDDTADLDGDADFGETLPQDLFTRPRVVDGEAPAGAIVDMGAYEYNPGCTSDLIGEGCVVNGMDLAVLLGAWGPCPACAEDLNGDGVVDGFVWRFCWANGAHARTAPAAASRC